MDIQGNEVSHLASFEESMEKVNEIVDRMGGHFKSRQALAVMIVLLERIEQLERRLEANGIYE